MLTWLVEEVESPYGSVATLHWAVPDETNNSGRDLGTLKSTALQVELESAEDQLGAVLWNSNPAALAYLHTHVFKLPSPGNGADGEATTPSPSPLEGKRIVELGAGVGCLGIALAMAGARVAVTDMKELLPLMAYNVRLNAKRVLARSHGAGQCAALQWKWGPTVTTSVHKQLQRALNASAKSGTVNNSAEKDGGSASSSAAADAVVKRVLSTMATALEKPSTALIECSAALSSAAGESTTAPAAPVLPYHYVILCDALYGNPKDWPALLYTLTELLSTNPEGCEIVNFCEQRVNDVEGAFLKLLDQENERAYVPASKRDAVDDPLWSAVTESALKCCASSSMCAAEKQGSASSGATSSSAEAVELHKAREEATNALLNYILVQRRGSYQWTYTTEVVGEAQSELNMVIRATRIRWTRQSRGAAPSDSRRRPREADEDGHAHHANEIPTKKRKY